MSREAEAKVVFLLRGELELAAGALARVRELMLAPKRDEEQVGQAMFHALEASWAALRDLANRNGAVTVLINERDLTFACRLRRKDVPAAAPAEPKRDDGPTPCGEGKVEPAAP